MVVYNGQKFACASCIQGHRSSSCAHIDRPLFEIRKKGRPVSQCERCRERRKLRKLHVKCICDERPEPQAPVPWPVGRKTAPRRIPSVPAFPNGLKDIIRDGMDVHIPSSPDMQRDSTASPPGRASPSSDCSTASSSSSPSWHSNSSPRRTLYHASSPVYASWNAFGEPRSTDSPVQLSHRTALSVNSGSSTPLFCSSPTSYFNSSKLPGPEYHTGAGYIEEPWSAAPRPTSGFETSSDRRTSQHRVSATQELIARSAASIPPPPASRSPFSRSTVGRDISSFSLDTTTYSSTALRNDAAGFQSGLVRLSPLTCCAGRCGCPPETCRCGEDCTGCR